MTSDTVIFDDVGPALLRRMLIMRVGQEVDACEWLKRVPEGRQATFDSFELGDKIVRHYLKLEWKPRELVRMMPEYRWLGNSALKRAACVPAVVWWLDEGETISGGLLSAAECLWGGLNRWPQRGWIWKETPPTISLNWGGSIQLAMASWVPMGCVVVA